MRNKAVKNVVYSFTGQVLVLILGIISPRIMLVNYGSDVNGLITTISQIFVYMSLLEAGIGQAAKNALYKPFAENDTDEVSHVVSIAQSYYRKVTKYYGLGVFVLAVLSPFIIKTNVDKITVFWIIILEGMSGVINFYFSEIRMTVLSVDGKSYINNTINFTNKIVWNFAKIVLAYFGINIIALQIVNFAINIIKTVAYKRYFDKYYYWIEYGIKSEKEVLKDRNAYIINEIAWTVFSSTDMIVLSVFVSTKLASVYSIYNLVFSNLNLLLNTVYSSVSYILGQAYHENIKKYEIIHDGFMSIFVGIMTIFMSASYNLVGPFIKLYTSGVEDTNYIYSLLPLLFCLVQLLSWSRYVTGNLTGIAGYAKQVSYISLLESIINIVLSVIFVTKYSIVGVLVATVIAMPIKVIFCMYISDRVILKRSCRKTVSILVANYFLFALAILANKYMNFETNSYLEFLERCMIYTTIFLLLGICMNCLVNGSLVKMVKLRKMV